MPFFDAGGGVREPFGKNVFLASTQDVKTVSATFAQDAIPVIEVDDTDQKILQPGTVIARITSGPDEGKVGVFQDGASDGRQTAANIVGLSETFLPWELLYGDREIAVIYECAANQQYCIEWDDSDDPIALTNATRDAIVARPNLSILFR